MVLGNFKNQGLVDFVEVHYINQNNLKNNINTIQCMLNLNDCVWYIRYKHHDTKDRHRAMHIN